MDHSMVSTYTSVLGSQIIVRPSRASYHFLITDYFKPNLINAGHW